MREAQLTPATSRFLTGIVAHELRTPLHSLMGFLELLAEHELPDDAQRLLAQVMNGADGLLVASDRVQVLVRLLAESYEVHPSDDVVLAELLGSVAAAYSTRSEVVQIRVSPALPEVIRTDGNLLRQILLELTENAVLHGKRPVLIAVESETAPSGEMRMSLNVRDDGTGVPSAVREELRRGMPTPPAPGTGLGLFLAQRLAVLAGGRVDAGIASNGSHEIRLTLPVTTGPAPTAPATAPAIEAPSATAEEVAAVISAAATMPEPRLAPEVTTSPSAAPPLSDTRPLRVLLAEDHPVNRLLAERQIKRLGHELVVVPGGLAAVNLALMEDFDIILLDRHLPDIDGEVAARHIREAEEARGGIARVPIVAITADASVGAREACLAAGMDDFLTKPVDLHELAATIARYGPGGPGVSPERSPGDERALQRLADHFERDWQAIADVVHTYRSELPGRRLLVQAALRRGSTQELLSVASSLESASLTVGAANVAEVCAEITSAGRRGDLSAVRDLLPPMVAACEAAEEWLQPYADASAWERRLS